MQPSTEGAEGSVLEQVITCTGALMSTSPAVLLFLAACVLVKTRCRGLACPCLGVPFTPNRHFLPMMQVMMFTCGVRIDTLCWHTMDTAHCPQMKHQDAKGLRRRYTVHG